MTTVAKEMGCRPLVAGDIGLEIEVEGENLPKCIHYWRNEHDGSLKGPSREYVLSKPSSLEEVKTALNYLEKCYVNCGTEVRDTVRAGVHVHINCQKLTMTQLYNFMTVYLILENLLVKWCGQYREGNMFCLRACDAEYLLYAIAKAAEEVPGKGKYKAHFRTDMMRYASMNVKALGDYGSLEFRAMRSTRDLNLIYNWAETLLGLREFAKKFDNPADIVSAFSMDGPVGFATKALGKHADAYLVEDAEEMLWEGLYNAQDIAYCADWKKYEPKMRKIGELEFLETEDPDEPEEAF